MYKILCNNTLIYNSAVDELALIDPVVELEENCAGSFSFTVPPTHPFYDLIQKRKTVIQVHQDDELIFSGMPIETEVDFYKQKKVFCEGELSYLNDSVQRPAQYKDISVRGLLEAYINNHNAQVEEEKQFAVGMVTVHDPNDRVYCFTNMESTMQCLQEDLYEDLGGYFRVRHENGVKYIDYLADSMHTNQQVIRLGENLIDFKSNIDSTDIATAIIPLGAKLETSPIEGLDARLDIKSVNGGLDYVCSQSAVQNYGWIYKTVEWDNVTIAANLKEKGEEYLSSIQFENMIIEAKAIDLHLIDSDEERFKLSDQIRVVSESHGLNRYFRITKQTINLNNPENDAITLGKEERTSLSAKTNQVNEAIYKAMESIIPPSKILQQAKDNATALINGNGTNGYLVLHENDDGVVYEILIMDTPDISTATKIWRWNQNGLGFANSKDANGNWQFGLAMTMDGAIVADFITTGHMNCDRLDGGVINGQTINGGQINGSHIRSESDSNGSYVNIRGGALTVRTISGQSYLKIYGSNTSTYLDCGGNTWGSTTSDGHVEAKMYDVLSAYAGNSDIRIKSNVEDLDVNESMDLIINAKLHKFNVESHPQKKVGVIAQEVIPQIEKYGGFDNFLVREDTPSGMYRVEYEQYIPHLMNVVQNQQKEIRELKDKIAECFNDNKE